MTFFPLKKNNLYIDGPKQKPSTTYRWFTYDLPRRIQVCVNLSVYNYLDCTIYILYTDMGSYLSVGVQNFVYATAKELDTLYLVCPIYFTHQ